MGWQPSWQTPDLTPYGPARWHGRTRRQTSLPPCWVCPHPTSHDGLKEKHFGAIQGIPKSELAELNPALLEQILRRNPAAEFVGGEGLDEFVDRVLAALDDIGARHAGERVLVVTPRLGPGRGHAHRQRAQPKYRAAPEAPER
jgi:hypothetical protein